LRFWFAGRRMRKTPPIGDVRVSMTSAVSGGPIMDQKTFLLGDTSNLDWNGLYR